MKRMSSRDIIAMAVLSAVIIVISAVGVFAAGALSPEQKFLKRQTKSCPNCSLIGASLGDADLRGANLSGANISGANLSGAQLTYTIWTDGSKCSHNSVTTCSK